MLLLLLLLLLNVMAAGVHERSFVRCRGNGRLVESGAMVERQKRCDVRRRMCGRLMLGRRSGGVLSAVRGKRRDSHCGHGGRCCGGPRCGRGAFGALPFAVVGRRSAVAAYG